MKKTFDFGKIDYHSKGRKINKVTVVVELKERSDKLVFSASGSVWNMHQTDTIIGGQCLDELKEFQSLANDGTFKLIYELWKKYHLNNMNAGTQEQAQAIEEWKKQGNKYDYAKVCEYLKSIDLYEVEHEGNNYKYGHGWIYYPIPENDLNVIKELLQ